MAVPVRLIFVTDSTAFMVALCLMAAIYPFLASMRFLPQYVTGREDPLPAHAENQKRFDRDRWSRAASRLAWLLLAVYFSLRWSSESNADRAADSSGPFMIAAAVLLAVSLTAGTFARYRWEKRFCEQNPRFHEALQPLVVRVWGLATSVLPILMIAAAIAIDSLPWVIAFGVVTLVLIVVRQKVLVEILARSRKEVPLDSPLAIGVSRMASEFGVQPKRFLLIPSLIANGWALQDGTIMLTAGLREIATDEELVAILAHEFSHAKDGDAKKIARANGYPLGLAAGAVTGLFLSIAILTPARMTPALIPAAISTTVAVVLLLRLPVLAYRRRLEFKCDAAAAAKGFGPDLASGLDKLHRYMGMPPHWGSLDAPFLTHPSLADRVARLVPTAQT